jgi:hypothetical protein
MKESTDAGSDAGQIRVRLERCVTWESRGGFTTF